MIHQKELLEMIRGIVCPHCDKIHNTTVEQNTVSILCCYDEKKKTEIKFDSNNVTMSLEKNSKVFKYDEIEWIYKKGEFVWEFDSSGLVESRIFGNIKENPVVEIIFDFIKVYQKLESSKDLEIKNWKDYQLLGKEELIKQKKQLIKQIVEDVNGLIYIINFNTENIEDDIEDQEDVNSLQQLYSELNIVVNQKKFEVKLLEKEIEFLVK